MTNETRAAGISNKAIDLVDDLIQAHDDYENASGHETIPARDAYEALRTKAIALLNSAMRHTNGELTAKSEGK